jgi:hypothetical protein
MSNHIEWGYVETALYTLHLRERVADELRPDVNDITAPYVLGIWNESGDGVALEGDRRQLLNFATALTAYLERETSPLPALSHALAELHVLRQRRGAALEDDDLSQVPALDEQEVQLLSDVADTAAAVHDDLV